MKELPQVVRRLESSPIKELSLRCKELKRQGEDVYNLGQGIPYMSPPERVIDAIRKANENPEAHKYSDFFGLAPLREAIADRVSQQSGFPVDKEQVLVTAGAMAACKTVFDAYLGSGKKAVVVTPDYATHFSQLEMVGCAIEHHPMEESKRWNADIERLSSRKNIDLLLITNPGNPTGVNFSKEELKEINRLSRKNKFVVVSDETYGFLTYDGRKFTSLSEIDPENPYAITIGSFSKEYRMTGDRVGYMVVNDKEMLPYLARIHDANVGTVNHYAQYGALAALQGSDMDVHHKEYEEKRRLVAESIASIPGLTLCPEEGPEGAYYAFPKYEGVTIPSVDLTKKLLEDHGVVVIPGSAFGEGGEHHFRISYATDMNTMIHGLDNLEEGWKKISGYR